MKKRIWFVFGLFLFTVGLIACQAEPGDLKPEPVTEAAEVTDIEENLEPTLTLELATEPVESSVTEEKPEPTSTPGPKPRPRVFHHMAYDSQSDQVILFGGHDSATSSGLFFKDTWAYDLATNTWHRMKPDPSPDRGIGPMAYDSESDRVVLFIGGFANAKGSSTLEPGGETWAYDYDSNSWTNLEPVESPFDIKGTEMVYDIESDRMILFGGWATKGTGDGSNETWAYDYNTNTWTMMTPDVSPLARYFHAMAYDAESDRVILWGGDSPSPLPIDFSSVWAYDYNTDTWEELESTTAPEPVGYGAMVYDPEADLIILYAGTEVWTFDTNTDTWTQNSESPEPGNLFYHAMVFADKNGQVILFGGGPSLWVNFNKTWSYDLDSNTWTELTKR